MTLATALTGFVRALLIAVATSAAVFGLLVVFHPFAPAFPTTTIAPADTSSADALHAQIETVRASLSQTEAALEQARGSTPIGGTASGSTSVARVEMQIAAAIERRDLARRHATAIREALKSGLVPSALPEIRDSVLVGQLLSQQAALEGQIAIESVRLRASHPVMKALVAQRESLALQIRAQATNIAAALEAEAELDDTQIRLLQSQPAAPSMATPPADTSRLEAEASAERAQLDTMMDAYFAMRPAASVAATSSANPLSAPNLAVISIAGLAALVFQLGLALRRRRLAQEADLAAWQADHDEELARTSVPAAQPEAPLRRAS